jgi:hypothetical protein
MRNVGHVSSWTAGSDLDELRACNANPRESADVGTPVPPPPPAIESWDCSLRVRSSPRSLRVSILAERGAIPSARHPSARCTTPADRIGVRTQLSASARTYPLVVPTNRHDGYGIGAAMTRLSPERPGFSICGPSEGLLRPSRFVALRLLALGARLREGKLGRGAACLARSIAEPVERGTPWHDAVGSRTHSPSNTVGVSRTCRPTVGRACVAGQFRL